MFRSQLTSQFRRLNGTEVARTFVGCTTKTSMQKLTASKCGLVKARDTVGFPKPHHASFVSRLVTRSFVTIEGGGGVHDEYSLGKLHDQSQRKREVLKYPNGFVYEGDMASGLPHGLGKITLRDGKVFEGEFVNGVLQGQPRTLTTLWYHYEGDVLNGEPHGRGKQVFKSGEVREGEFCESAMMGQGKITYPNSTVNVGEFKNDMLNGPGIIYYSDGDRVETHFVDDCWDGVAKYYHSNGEINETTYVRGERQKREKNILPDGTVVEGEYLRAISHSPYLMKNRPCMIVLRHGLFKYTYPSGLVEEGEMKYGERVGRWKYTYPNGATTTEEIPMNIAKVAKIALERYHIFSSATRYRDFFVCVGGGVVYVMLRGLFFA